MTQIYAAGGVIQGGWGYVLTAYAITALVLGGYTSWLAFRWQREGGPS